MSLLQNQRFCNVFSLLACLTAHGSFAFYGRFNNKKRKIYMPGLNGFPVANIERKTKSFLQP